MNGTKDLFKSKTFYFALLGQLIGLAVLAGAITAADGEILQANGRDLIEGIFMIVSSSGAIWGRIAATDMIKRINWLPF